jgi:hypothetical protein
VTAITDAFDGQLELKPTLGETTRDVVSNLSDFPVACVKHLAFWCLTGGRCPDTLATVGNVAHGFTTATR